MSHRLVMVAVVMALLGGANADAQPGRATRRREVASREPLATPAELRSLGANYMQSLVNRYGQVTDSGTVRLVGSVVEPIRRVAGYARSDFRWYVVGDTEINAEAIPGGFMRVNIGLVTLARQLAADEYPGDATKRYERTRAYLAAVIGHEMAHLALGHTDSIRGMLAPGAAANDTRERRIEAMMRDPENLQRQKHTREQELAADRVGAWFDLRAGWDIQTPMDLFRVLDSLERGGPRAIDDVTWLRDHPRSSQREAELEAFRAELKRDQSRYDDALTLVRNGVMLDTAVTLIDTVIVHFPELREARQLRAAAFQRMFVRNASPAQLKVRSFVGTYEARFLPGIRAAFTPQAEVALSHARSAYVDALHHGVLPYTLSNLAVLDAYAGATQLAAARADSAVAMDRDNAVVRLNRGVVRYLAGDYARALQDFQAAQAGVSSTSIITFDIGRTMLAMGNAAGRDSLRVYAADDDEGDWHDEALRLAGTSPRPSPSVTPAGSAAHAPSGLALPVNIGARPADVRRALGAPDEMHSGNDAVVWYFKTRGIVVVLTSAGVAVVGLRAPDAGSIDGVRVGDPLSKARAAWGRAVDEQDGTSYFRRDDLVIAADADSGTIVALSVGRP